MTKIVKKQNEEKIHMPANYVYPPIHRKKWFMLFFSVFFGIYFTLVYYPGVMYTDSYNRLKEAIVILSPNSPHLASWLSITPSFFMAFLYALTFNFASFTLVQSVLFFLSSFLMVDKFVAYNKIAVSALFVICPIFYGYSIFWDMSVGCVIGINFGILLLLDKKLNYFKNWKIRKKIVYFIALFIWFYIAFGFRQNAFTILPVIIAICMYYFIKKYKDRLLFALQIGVISFSLVFVNLFPAMLGITVLNSYSSGFVWEILSIIQEMPENKRADYNDYLDFIAGEGSTLQALAVNNKASSINDWLWDVFDIRRIGDKNKQTEILRKYIRLAVHETNYYLKVKAYFLGRTLGLTKPLLNLEFYYNRDNQMSSLGMAGSKLRYILVNSYNYFQDTTVIFRIPWVWFLMGLLSVIWQLAKADGNHHEILMLYMVAAFYYAAFLITNQSFEFRYFFPSFYMLFIIIADTIIKIVHPCLMILRSVIHKQKSVTNE